jgi:hypothetical protein
MNVPSIGGARGLFEVFVPGVFLVLNVGVLIVRIVCRDSQQEIVLGQLSSSTTIMAGVILATGYLAGAVLRLLKTEAADVCSTLCRRLMLKLTGNAPPRGKRRPLKDHERLNDRTRERNIHGYYQRFPYESWLCTKVARGLGPRVEGFVRSYWSRDEVPQLDTTFVNHCKTILAQSCPALHAQLVAEESLVRFVASMFYALLLSLGVLLVSWYWASQSANVEPVLLVAYSLAILGILVNFRHLRAKEAAMFLSACYACHVRAESLEVPSEVRL